MAYFLAVDAGGTKAEFLLAEEDRELARVTCGTVKRLNATEDQAARNLDDALARLTAQTGFRMDKVTRTCIGTSGNTVPLVTNWLRENFASRVSGTLRIAGDVEIALEAAFPGERGILVLSGTGSNVAGRGADGKIITAGGWGPMLADQGAGHWIGLEALRRGFLAIDQQRPTSLLELARDHWRLPSVKALIEFANSEPRPPFADLTPLVVECAAKGDDIAGAILDQSGKDLAYLARLAIERIMFGEDRRYPLPAVATAGSVLGKIERVRDALVASLRADFPKIQFILEPADPVVGALHYARAGA
ncbi:MAG TPA: BadF/BadG/BcrA/BcrD ATPase family protein [Terracidiphilus sp.]|jgi:N-acetylglucosamine kinase-like BadF-type ATPase|nr:BadF/BadG/BcrA/BcrD ATPase family protein [Terracidiphilus sp.]